MSVTLTTRIRCDLPEGCTATYEAASWPGDARAAAARAGWSSNPDRCPAHPPGVPAAGAPTLFDDFPEAAAMLTPPAPTAAASRPLTGQQAAALNAAAPAGAPVAIAGQMFTLRPGQTTGAPGRWWPGTPPYEAGEGLLQYLCRAAGAPPAWRLERHQIAPGYDGEALLDPSGAYRYALTRRWAAGRTAAFVMLNPSTADAAQDDATIRRCVGYAKRWRYGQLLVLNLFGARATDPAVMKRFADPVGPDNDLVIEGALTLPVPPALKVGRVVLAWGTHGPHLGRDAKVTQLVRYAWGVPLCLALTAGAHPAHPLRLRGDLVAFEYPAVAA